MTADWSSAKVDDLTRLLTRFVSGVESRERDRTTSTTTADGGADRSW